MAYRNFALFFILYCFNFWLTSNGEISKAMPGNVEEPSENIKDLKMPVFDGPSLMEVDQFQDLMLDDATQGTTPAVCTPNMTCGFQEYMDYPDHYFYYPFIKYCNCPDDHECIVSGQSMKRRFFYYTCQYVKQSDDSEVNTAGTAVSISSIAEHSTVTSMNFGNESNGES